MFAGISEYSFFEKYNLASRINKIIYFHKFYPQELGCFWPKFLKYREKCAEPGYEYFDSPPLCDPSMWYRERMTDPILSGKNYHRFEYGFYLIERVLNRLILIL